MQKGNEEDSEEKVDESCERIGKGSKGPLEGGYWGSVCGPPVCTGGTSAPGRLAMMGSVQKAVKEFDVDGPEFSTVQ